MSPDDIIKIISRRIEAIDLAGVPRELYQPLAYCLENGGKRIRPAMTLLACQMFGGDIEKAVHPAIGLELFHNFTLMHDDIMDGAPIRRGQPSVHAKWNANTAILSGDVMFAIAGQYMTRVDDACLRQVMETYHKTAIEVCEGQQYDMNFETCPGVSLDEYIEMIRLKTAVLPAACLKIGAMLAGADPADQEHIYRFGEYIGLAFQLRDDWLDAFGDEARFGKKNGGDIIANKKTWLYIKALELSDPARRETLLGAYSSRPADPAPKISAVKDIFFALQIDKLGVEQMEAYYRIAFNHLDRISTPDADKENLRTLARMLFDREV